MRPHIRASGDKLFLKKNVKLFFYDLFSVVVGTKKLTDLLTSFIKIAISQLTGTNLKKELLWPLPRMYLNTTEYSKSFISFCFCQYLHRFCNLIEKYNFSLVILLCILRIFHQINIF